MMLTVNEDLMDYIECMSSDVPVYLQEITRETYLELYNPNMLCSPSQGRFLAMISKILCPNKILELGTYVGYSTLCLAEGLAGENARIDTVERSDELEERIIRNFQKSGLCKHICLHIDDALHYLRKSDLMPCSIDLIYIDADKRQYSDYFDLCLPLLRPDGVLLADNTLWSGHVIDNRYDRDAQTMAIRAFNEHVADMTEVETMILPVYDGMTLVRKR